MDSVKMHGILWMCVFLESLIGFFADEIPGHLKPLGHHRKPLGGVTILEDFPTPTDFYENYIEKSVPFVVKGVLEKGQFPAYKLWTDSYLSKTYGKIYIDVEGGKKENRSANQYVMPMSKFLQIYNQSNIYMVYDVATKMKNDITLPISVQCGGLTDLIRTVIMWFSSGGTKSVLHNDGLDNINCLMDGKKDLIMFDKKYKKEIEADQWVKQGAFSRVDVESVDMEKFPKLRDLDWYMVNITKGDCLFIPYQWYHHVYSHSGRNLAINTWFDHARWFNRTDCEAVEGELKPKSLSQYNLPGMGQTDTNVFVNLIFDDVDSVSRSEFITIMKEKTDITEDGPLNEVFEFIDKDKDDVLTMYEFYAADFKEIMDEGSMEDSIRMDWPESESEPPPNEGVEPRVIEMDDDVSFLINPNKQIDERIDIKAKEEL